MSNVNLSSMDRRCSHEPLQWYRPSTGKTTWSPHPPLFGKEAPVLVGGTADQREESSDAYLTTATAKYPAEFTWHILARVVLAAHERATPPPPVAVVTKPLTKSPQLVESDHAGRPMVTFRNPLKGQKPATEVQQVGSLRNMARSLQLVPGHAVAGFNVQLVLLKFLESHPSLGPKCCSALGSDTSMDQLISRDDLTTLRGQVAAAISKGGTPESKACLQLDGAYEEHSKQQLQGHLIHAWATWAGDPAAHTAEWLWNGAPAGIEKDFVLDGVLEAVENESPADAGELVTNHETFTNYTGVENSPDAVAIIDDYIRQNWLQEFSSLADLRAFVGGEPILNKFACISKERPDGTMKHRIIMDSRRSGVTAASKKMYRAVLPRHTDMVHDILELLSKAQPAEDIEMLVLDAVDAFWQVPLHEAERKYYCGILRSSNGSVRYLAYTRTAQGSRGGPLSWAIQFGLICRLALSCIRDPVIPDAEKLQVYVDDPALAVRGTPANRKFKVSMLMLAWTVLGVTLAVKKGQLGRQIDWIGATFNVVDKNTVVVTIMEARLKDLLQLARSILAENVVAVKTLRTFTGKAQSMASLLYTWRPFVHMLYAVIHGAAPEGRENCRWTRQIHVPLHWLIAFLTGISGNLERKFTVDAYLRKGDSIVVTTDASPYGIGGVLEVNGKIVSYFADSITQLDRSILGLSSQPSSADQQALEALAALVALREWAKMWLQSRVRLCVQGDNTPTLAMVTKMQPHSQQLGVIAREMALDIAAASYSPDVAVHIPGVANVVADCLSRIHAPDKKSLPFSLRDIPESKVANRNRSWWRALPPTA